MRLMVIGWDGATFRNLEAWSLDGWMPNFSRLVETGACGVLKSTTPPVTAPAWVSCFSGVNPGKHGIYNFVRPGTIGGPLFHHSSRDVRAPRLWNMLGRAGLVVHVLDVPLTYPPEPVTGVMVSDLMVSGARHARTSPPTLQEELRRHVGTGRRWAIADRLEVSAAYLRHLAQSVEEKLRLDLYVLRSHPADAVFSVYQHMDVLNHYFWHVWDSTHPLHDPREAATLMPWIRGVVRRMDRALGRLCRIAGEEALVAVVSDHGFGPARVRVHINDLLLGWGDAVFSGTERYWLKVRQAGLTPSRLASAVKRADRWGIRRLLPFRSVRRAFSMVEAIGPAPDRGSSRAWFPHSLSPGIVLSDVARGKSGYVEMLMARLRDVRLSSGSTPCFERVARREEVYHGDVVDGAPDIVLQMAEGFVATAEVTGGNGFIRTGTGQVSGFHRPEGVLVLSGPTIVRGMRLTPCSIMDVTPTLLRGLGLDVPLELDGHCVEESFEENGPTLQAGLQDGSGVPVDGLDDDVQVFDPGEEGEIARRLRTLGYL